MSRHSLNPRDESFDVIVGWDPPLHTYFVQVLRPADPATDNDDEMIVWRGFGRYADPPDEILTLGIVDELIKPYAAPMPAAVRRQLVIDKSRNQ